VHRHSNTTFLCTITRGFAWQQEISRKKTPSLTNWCISTFRGTKISLLIKRHGCILNVTFGSTVRCKLSTLTPSLSKGLETNLTMSSNNLPYHFLVWKFGRKNTVPLWGPSSSILSLGTPEYSNLSTICLPRLYLWWTPKDSVILSQMCRYLPISTPTKYCIAIYIYI